MPYNGKDDDCNPATPDDDLDGDTYPVATDCDDTDASVNPGATEVCDGIDNNCDGTVDEGCGVEEANLLCVQYRFGTPAPGYTFAGWPIFESWLQVRIQNYGPGDAFNVTATISSWPANNTIVDGNVALGNINAGSSAWSSDNYQLQVDMAHPVDQSLGVTWTIEYDDAGGGHHTILNVPQ